MLLAASLLPQAQIAIEWFLANGRHDLKEQVEAFRLWLQNSGKDASAEEVQRRFTYLRLRFNAVLTQLDLFSDVISRQTPRIGVWLSGLDVVSADALALPDYYQAPPVICYLDRGIGAAIRRARTRLPGGGENPVAIVRVPRERMIGSGIASSLIHEVGHQASVLLGLAPSILSAMQAERRKRSELQIWALFERWISEILADFWSVARVGIVSTLGLIGVVSLPRPFVFRIDLDDPHPMPWIRVKLSCAMGQALYPHPQWHTARPALGVLLPHGRARRASADPDRRRSRRPCPEFVPSSSITAPNPARQVTPRGHEGRSPPAGAADGPLPGLEPGTGPMYQASPSLIFAVLGHAKAEGKLSPEDEGELLGKLLNHWAMRSTLDTSAFCATLHQSAGSAISHLTKGVTRYENGNQ